MKTSVVLVTYNRAALLSATIESILSQTYGDFELIISDDCSSDSTRAVCERYVQADRRIRYRRNRTNVGMPANLNAAIRTSSGSYVATLHDGDLFDPSLLAKWVAALDGCPDAAFAFNGYRSIDNSGRTIRIFLEDLPACFPGTRLVDLILGRWLFGSPVRGTVIARRTAYDSVGLFDGRFGFWADVDMWLRLGRLFDVAYVPEPLMWIPQGTLLGTQGVVANLGARQGTLEAIFWEARRRRAGSNPAKLIVEAIRHGLSVVFARSYWGALAVRRRLRAALR